MAVLRALKPGESLKVGDDITITCEQSRKSGLQLMVRIKEEPRYRVELIRRPIDDGNGQRVQ